MRIIPVIVSIICITILVGMALYNGLDGQLLTGAIGLLASLGTYAVYSYYKERARRE